MRDRIHPNGDSLRAPPSSALRAQRRSPIVCALTIGIPHFVRYDSPPLCTNEMRGEGASASPDSCFTYPMHFICLPERSEGTLSRPKSSAHGSHDSLVFLVPDEHNS